MSHDIDWSVTHGKRGARTLILVLHGLNCAPSSVASLVEAALRHHPEARVLVPSLPLQWFRRLDFRKLARRILDRVEKEVAASTETGGRPPHVVLVGHSAGGVLAQTVYLLSRLPSNSRTDTALRAELSSGRLVLVAPLSRGWEIDHHLPLGSKLMFMAGRAVLPLIDIWGFVARLWPAATREKPWILQLRRSSPFLTWFRLTWLALHQGRDATLPEVVQLLGSVDELVSWRDMVDLQTGSRFLYLEVPFSDHASILDLGGSELGTQRRKVVEAAFGDPEGMEPFRVEPWDSNLPDPEPEVQRVVFVIHGIRDEGHWTQKIGARAQRAFARKRGGHAGGSGRLVRVVTSSYGYFSMLQFLLPWERRAKTHWLVENYVEAKRRFPKADFSFIGHSNGTYLLACMLREYPEVTFDKVAFAGSVVSTSFDWRPLLKRNQLSNLANHPARLDWVVGIFPNLRDVLPGNRTGLGGAGVVGFDEPPDRVRNLTPRQGMHSSAIQEDNWDRLAEFAVTEGPAWSESQHDLTGNWKRSAVWTVICLVSWLGLFALLFLGASAAWYRPASFWKLALVSAGLGFGLAMLKSRLGKIFATPGLARPAIKTSLGCLAVVALVTCAGRSESIVDGWWQAAQQDGIAALLELWKEPCAQGWRSTSFIAYLLLLYQILTRV